MAGAFCPFTLRLGTLPSLYSATETEESIKKRLHNAEKEIEFSKTPNFFDCVMENSDFEKTYVGFKDWILKQSTA